jgi:hypothetical protein
MRVPLHVGITGNEMADKAADLATRIIPHPKNSNLPTNDIKSSIKSKIYSKWQNYWDAIPPTNKLKKIKKDIKKWVSLHYLTRQQEIATTRCRIGPTFATHSFLISKNLPPICDKCHTDLSVHHIIQVSMKYRDIRTKLAIPPNNEEAHNEKNTNKIISFLTKINYINKL